MKGMLVIVGLLITQVAYAKVDVTVGPEVSYLSYREKSLPFGRDIITVKEDGVMYGVHGTIEYKDKMYLAADGRYSFGQVDYSGSGTVDGISDYIYELRGLIGIPIQKVVIYSGFGYRYLNDDASGKVTSDGSLSYLRESNYSYVPIGIKVWKLQGEVDVLVNGTQVSHLNDVDEFLPLLKHKQTSGAGIKLSVDFSRVFGRLDVHFTPFMRWWKVQESNVQDGFIEPRNTSFEIGGQISVKF